MKTHIIRAAGDSHFTVCGIDMRKHEVNAYGQHYSMKNITCKRCNGQAINH